MVARVPIEKKKTKRFVIPASVLARAGSKPGSRAPENSPFRLPDYPPLVSKNIQATMAMDDNIQQANAWATNAWVGGFAYNSAISEGLAFPGYAFLSELAQRPEYRRFAEITAMEMTRKWIKIQSKGDKTSGEDKTDRINELTDEMDRLQVRDMFRTLSEHDSYFGRGHLYIDTGDTNNREELKTSIGNGRNKLSRAKIGKGSIKRLATVEPVWCYPTSYDSADPLRTDWYNPTMWYAMGKEIHATRLLKFVGRAVPDLLKPSYSFGGLSMSQMAKPYVDNWLRARQSVADIMHAFSVFVLETDLQESLMQGGDQLFARIELFNQLRDNRGLMVLNKDSEAFQNVAASLGSLDLLQAQAQEHMAAVSGIPTIKLLGIQPAGLNASSEGEIRTFYDWVHSFQEKMFRSHLTTVIDFIQLSLWGDIDDDLTFAFEELWSLDEASLANKRKTEVETDTSLLDAGVISPEEIRQRIASDPTSPYASLDVDDLPDLKQEEEEGLEPKGSAEKLAAMGSGEEDDGEQGEENEPTDEDDNAEDAAFKEDEHPRKDDGKFGKGGGGGSSSKVNVYNIRGSFTTYENAKSEAKIVDWLNTKSISSDELKNSFLADLVTVDKPDLYLDDDNKLEFSAFDFAGDDSEMTRLIDIKNNTVEHRLLSLPNGEQGAGVAKKLLRSQMDLYKKLGIKKITTEANLEIGAYAWAKYGYLPTKASWFKLRRNLKDDRLSTEILEILENEDPRAMWVLSDTKEGKKLLLGKKWDAELDLSDIEAMKRFDAYVGK